MRINDIDNLINLINKVSVLVGDAAQIAYWSGLKIRLLQQKSDLEKTEAEKLLTPKEDVIK